MNLCWQSNVSAFEYAIWLVITFLPRSKRLLISWLQSPSSVILEPKKLKSDTVSTVSSSICHEVMGLDAMIFVFWMLSFKPTFSLSSFTFIKRLFSSSLSARRVMSSAYLRLFIFLYTNNEQSKKKITKTIPFIIALKRMQYIEMLDWMKHKLESRLLGEISITSGIQMTPPLWQKVKN